MTTLTDIFTESLVARLLPFAPEVTLPALWSFGEPPAAALVVAGIGGLLAGAMLYAIGIWLRRMPKHVSTPEQQARITKLHAGVKSWLPWALIFAPTPVGGIITIAAGFFAVRPWFAAAMLLVAEMLWRTSPMMN